MLKNKFTKGEFCIEDKWTVRGGNPSALVCKVYPWDVCGCKAEDTQNVELVMSAFRAATALDALGYDALAVLEELPRIVKYIEKSGNSGSRTLLAGFLV